LATTLGTNGASYRATEVANSSALG
jgi:hypothetical protein